jgi:hypothetical protein
MLMVSLKRLTPAKLWRPPGSKVGKLETVTEEHRTAPALPCLGRL